MKKSSVRFKSINQRVFLIHIFLFFLFLLLIIAVRPTAYATTETIEVSSWPFFGSHSDSEYKLIYTHPEPAEELTFRFAHGTFIKNGASLFFGPETAPASYGPYTGDDLSFETFTIPGSKIIIDFRPNTTQPESGQCFEVDYVSALLVERPIDDLLIQQWDDCTKLYFTAPEGASSVVVERSSDLTTWMPVSTETPLSKNSTSATILNTDRSTEYYYRLNVTGGIREGTSNEVCNITNEQYFAFSDGVITDYLSPYDDEYVNIPDTINGETVVGIGENAFAKSYIHSVVIPSTVTSIDPSAFQSTKSELERVVVLGNSLKTIGDNAFSGCSALTEVVLPDSVESIGESAFENCSSLSLPRLPRSLSSLGESAFAATYFIESLVVNDALTLNYGALNFTNVISLTLDETVSSVSTLPLDNLSLEKITVAEDNPYFSSAYGVLFDREKTKLIRYPANLTKDIIYSIPKTVTTISNNAFYNCTSLSYITIPDSVTTIGSNVFRNCSNLCSIRIPNSVTSIGYHGFSGTGIQQINIPASVASLGMGAFKNCTALKYVGFFCDIYEMPAECFYGCSDLSAIAIPKRVGAIGEQALDYRYDYDIYYGGTEEDWDKIGYALSQDFSYSTPTYPTDKGFLASRNGSIIKHIGYDTSITVPSVINEEPIVSISSYAFSYSTNLKDVTLSEGLLTIWSSAFRNSNIERIRLPSTLTTIASYAFADCDSLTYIKIPESVTEIYSYAFSGCESLSAVAFSQKMDDVESNVRTTLFDGCDFLYVLCYPGSEEHFYTEYRDEIDIWNFYRIYCNADLWLTENGAIAYAIEEDELVIYHYFGTDQEVDLTVFKSLSDLPMRIAGQAFLLSSIESITLPDNLCEINSGAFSSCSSLSSVTYQGAKAQWDAVQVWPTDNTSLLDCAFTFLKYMVTYDANGGTNAPTAQIADSGSDLTIAQETPTRAFRTFLGWSTSSTGSVSFLPDDTYTGSADITLYAVWSEDTRAVADISISTMPDKLTYYTEDTLDTTGLSIIVRYEDGNQEILSSSFTCTPDTLTNTGTQAITVAYRGKTTSFNVTVKELVLTSIQINTLPSDTEYLVGERLDMSGLTLTASYNNGSTGTISSGFSCDPTVFYMVGTQTITVTYEGMTTSFPVTVNPGSTISINTLPKKTDYYVGDTLDTTALTLTETYNDGTSRIITSGFTCSPTQLKSSGFKSITVNYNGQHTSFDVYVRAVQPSSIAVNTPPSKVTYIVGDTLNTAGLSLTVTYNNGSTSTVSYGFTCSPTTFTSAGTQTVTVTYSGKTTDFEVTVDEVALAQLSVKTLPDKVNYFVGDLIDTAGLSLTATYNNGSTETISAGFTCSPIVLKNAGTQVITVSLDGKTTSFSVSVEEVIVTAITVKTRPNKLYYYVGETLDTTGLSLTATYNNGSTKTISSDFDCSPTTFSKVGAQAITVSFAGKTTSFNVIVEAVALSSISVKTMPDKVDYFVGDTLNTTGLLLTATYDNGYTETVSTGFTCSPTELTTVGVQSITVFYGDHSTSFTVSVQAVTLSSISIKTLPDRLDYYTGNTLNTTGLTLTATYSNGSTEAISSGFTCSPIALSNTGTQVITVSYNGKTTSFTVSVQVVTLSSISVKTMPRKVNYYIGDTFDPAGLTLTVTYSDGGTTTVSSGFTCSPTAFTTAGTQTISIAYSGKSTSFDVSVEEVVLSSISVKSLPDKLEYFVGDTLDTTGLTLTGTYNNGNTETISSGFTCSPTDLSTVGTHAITVSYNGKATSFNVSVEAIALSSISVKTMPDIVNYYVGDRLNTVGLTLTATYNNGSTQTISYGFTCTPTTFTTAGTQTVLVSYSEKTTSFDVTVDARTPVYAAIESLPSTTVYPVGSVLDPHGLSILIIYDDSTSETITSGFTFTPSVLSTVGTQTISVHYEGIRLATFDVTVVPVELVSLSVATAPNKTIYYVGDTLDTTGLTLTAVYDNGSTATISSGFACSPTVLSSAGMQTISVSYGEKTTNFTVTVDPVTLEYATIASEPYITVYPVDTVLETDGLAILLVYNNGSTETVTSGFSCTPMLLSTVGTQYVTVHYKNISLDFVVTVVPAELVSLSVKNTPDKISYYVGDVLDVTGLTLTATYNNHKTETISSGFTCSPTTFTSAGKHQITVVYNGILTSFDVKVLEKQISIAGNVVETGIQYQITTSYPCNVAVIAAKYDNNGKLLECHINKHTMVDPADIADSQSFSVDGTAGCYYKLFLVDAVTYVPLNTGWCSLQVNP